MKKRKQERKLFLDGLRGWASLMVLLHALFISIFYVHPGGQAFLNKIVLFSGPLGICILFVVSGFALSAAHTKKLDTDRLAEDAASRYFRLVIPVVAACFLAYLGLESGAIPVERPRLLAHILRFDPSFVGFLQFSLWDVFFDFRPHQAYMLPLWVMQHVLAGSVLVYGMLLFFRPVPLRLYIYLGLTILLLLFASYYALFIGGMILAELYQQGPQRRNKSTRKALEWVLIFALFIPWLSHNEPSTTMMLGAILLVAAGIWLPAARAVLEHRTSQFLGRIAFALYLVHPLLIYSYGARLFYGVQDHGYSEPTAALITGFITLPLSIVAAMAFAPIDHYAHLASRRIGKKLVSGVHALVYAARERLGVS